MEPIERKGKARNGKVERCPKPDDLTLKQQRWLEFYLITQNATKAARQAGYAGSESVLGTVGHQNLRNYEIKRRIEDRVADSKVEANEVIGTLVSQMRADMTEILTPGGHLDIELVRDKRLGHLIKKVKTRRYVENRGTKDAVEVELTEVELHNPQTAAMQLCKVLGIEKQPGANPVDVRSAVDNAVQMWCDETGGTRQEALRFLGRTDGMKDQVKQYRALPGHAGELASDAKQ